jgi:TorA maturation chaperone TorD
MEMREGVLDERIRAAESVGLRAEAAGVAGAPCADRAVSPGAQDEPEPTGAVDEVDLLRAHEYRLLALLFGRAPTADVLARVAELTGDASPLGLAHIELAQAAEAADADAVSREYFDLFIGLGRGELLPYGSYYLTGFLHERPLARVRKDLARLGIERVEEHREPEDHIAILCEVMAGLADGRFGVEREAERSFFERHLQPWAPQFFADCETSRHGRFYRAAGLVGRLFMEIEAQAFAMDA